MACPVTNFKLLIFFFINLRLCRSYSIVQIYFIKSSGNSVIWYFNVKWALALSESAVPVANWSIFVSLPIQQISLFLCLPGGFLASHDPVSSSFLNILWITLFDSPQSLKYLQSSLSSLHNMTISFLSSSDITNLFVMLTMYELVKNRCNLVKYPILYSYPNFF